MTTPLATPPSRADSVNFAARADSFLASLLQFQTEMDALGASTEFNKNYVASAWQAAGGITVGLGQAVAAAAQASAAADRAEAAWASAAAPAEKLAAMSQSFHVGALVKTLLYDTSKDSDGGAWRQRCQQTSWYQEALGGDRWIGQQATIAAAWAAAGNATGAVFQASATAGPLTIGKYYTATSSTAATEVFRGVARDFPALALIAAEANRVVIYDASAPGCPMWKVISPINFGAIGDGFWRTSRVATSVFALGGVIYFGVTLTGLEDAAGGLCFLNFVSGIAGRYPSATVINGGVVQIADYQVAALNDSLPRLNSGQVNDVAVTVLDNAPIDPATGLPVPTIAVATAGGVSVIKHDGTVVNSAATVLRTSVAIGTDGTLYHSASDSAAISAVKNIGSLTASFVTSDSYNQLSAPALLFDFSRVVVPLLGSGRLARGSGLGVDTLALNPTTPAKGMVARITKDHNSGWQVGDSRGAWLADTVAETASAAELVANGGFADGSNWTPPTGWAIGSGVLNKTANTLNPVVNVGTVVAGKQYRCTFDITTETAAGSGVSIRVGGTSGGFQTGVGTKTELITASANGSIEIIARGATGDWMGSIDNVSVKPVDADRSVKANGLNIVGSITKEPVATGAQLVAYSGLGPSNYFEQPYSPNLDIGTGDFCAMWWERPAVIAAARYRFSRGVAGASELLGFSTNTSGQYVFSAGASTLVSTGVNQSLGNNFICYFRVAGVLYVYVNAALIFSTVNTANLTSTDATLRLGTDHRFSFGGLPMSLFRFSATPPSADQIAKIYRDELALMQPGAQCTIAGTSTAVTAMTYDDGTDLLQVGTNWGRTSFNNLVRVDSEATPVGAVTTITAQGGAVVMGGTSGRIYQPALTLRDELRRKREARLALGRVPFFKHFDATASQTTFVLDKGTRVVAVYAAGTLKREGVTKDYTITDDGFQQSVVFGTGLAASTWVSVMVVRT